MKTALNSACEKQRSFPMLKSCGKERCSFCQDGFSVDEKAWRVMILARIRRAWEGTGRSIRRESADSVFSSPAGVPDGRERARSARKWSANKPISAPGRSCAAI